MLTSFAKGEVLERKNELGLILDLVASCLDMDPKKRPTINGIPHSRPSRSAREPPVFKGRVRVR